MSDYISREAAVKVLTSIALDVPESKSRAVAKCINQIELLPAADVQPVRRWIPCSKKLPLDGEDVLVWDAIEGDVFTGALLGGVFWVDGFDDKGFAWNITHWMPLPEPPEEVLP